MSDLIDRDAAIKEVEEWAEHGHDLIHWTGIKAMLETQPAVDAVPICWLENLRDRIIMDAMGNCEDGGSVDVTDARCVHRTLELIREGMKKC